MGDKVTKGFKPQAKDAIPGYHPYRRLKDYGSSFEAPKAPEATEAEKQLANRQREEIARLDDEENTRLKRGLRGQLGSRRLLSSVRTAKTASSGASAAGGTAAAAGGGGGGGTHRAPGGKKYALD